MDFFEVVRKRCSTREFSDKPVTQEILRKLADAARLAPTARMEQPWEFVAVTERKSLNEIGEITDHGKFIKDSAACIAVVCRDTKYYLEDGCAATENILLAAAALGIGSCWVAGDKKEYAPRILQFLKVPAGYKLVSLIALGYPKKDFTRHDKRLVDDVLRNEFFDG